MQMYRHFLVHTFARLYLNFNEKHHEYYTSIKA